MTPDGAEGIFWVISLVALMGCFGRWNPLRAVTVLWGGICALLTFLYLIGGQLFSPAGMSFAGVWIGLMLCAALPRIISAYLEGDVMGRAAGRSFNRGAAQAEQHHGGFHQAHQQGWAQGYQQAQDEAAIREAYQQGLRDAQHQEQIRQKEPGGAQWQHPFPYGGHTAT